MSIAQAVAQGAIRFRGYYRRRLVVRFNRSRGWPFLWDVGMRLQIGRHGWLRVTKITHHSNRNLTRIYFKKEFT